MADELKQVENAFTSEYGLSDIPAMAATAFDVGAQIQHIVVPFAGVALLIFGMRFVTNIWLGDGRVDWLKIFNFAAMCMFLFFYSEVMHWILSMVKTVSDGVGHSSAGTLASKVVELTQAMLKQQAAEISGELKGIGETMKQGNVTQAMWDMAVLPLSAGAEIQSSMWDSIVSSMTVTVVIVARTVTYCIREVTLVFLVAVGPIAIVLSLFPGFENNLNNWLRHVVSVAFWGITLGVLDRIMVTYIDHMIAAGNTVGFIPMNICLAIMYCMAPAMTAKYISHGASSVMSRMVGYVSRTTNVVKGQATQMMRSATSSAASGAAKSAAGSATGGGGNPLASAAGAASSYSRTPNTGGAGFGRGSQIKSNSNIA